MKFYSNTLNTYINMFSIIILGFGQYILQFLGLKAHKTAGETESVTSHFF